MTTTDTTPGSTTDTTATAARAAGRTSHPMIFVNLRFLVTRANGQPAVGMYLRKGSAYEAFQFQALRVDAAGRVDDVVGWFEARFFRLAGLPLVLEA